MWMELHTKQFRAPVAKGAKLTDPCCHVNAVTAANSEPSREVVPKRILFNFDIKHLIIHCDKMWTYTLILLELTFTSQSYVVTHIF